MKNRVALFLLGALLSLGVPVSSLADSHESPPNVASVWVVTPNAGQEAEFETALKAHGDWRAANGDPRSWNMYSVVAGNDRRPLIIRACCFNWAEQDAYDQWSDESGAGEHFGETVGSTVDTIEHYFQTVDHANSNWPADMDRPNMVGVTKWTPNPANAGASTIALGEMSTLAKENGWPTNWLWIYNVGGDAALSLAVPYADFGAMEPPEQSFAAFAAEHVGQEAAGEMLQAFSSGFWGSEYTIYRWRPDLSSDTGED